MPATETVLVSPATLHRRKTGHSAATGLDGKGYCIDCSWPDKPKLYFDFNDWWVGYYRGVDHHYICVLPTVVLRIPRRKRRSC